jgi:hypothetical protein
VRFVAVLRGQQLMAAILSVFPGVQIVDYDASFPDSWDAQVQQNNGVSDAYAQNLDVNFWDGMTSVNGYSGIWLYDETFYKTYEPASSWAQALSYEENSVYAYLSQNFSNWSYASSRVFPTPSAWIDGDAASNEASYDAPRPPDYVAQQLEAFRDWGTGGAFAVFSYAPLGQFDYSPYVPGIQAAASPGIVDTDPPAISVTSQTSNGDSLALSGTANDDYAIQSVNWSSSTGAAGTAQDAWQITSGSVPSGYQSQTNWSIPSIPIAPGANVITVTAVDTHGLTKSVTIGG